MLALQPAPQPTVRVDGPPPGLASGRHDVPRSLIGITGAIIVAVGIGYLLARLRRRGKR